MGKSEKQKREALRAKGETVFEPLVDPKGVKMLNAVRALYGNFKAVTNTTMADEQKAKKKELLKTLTAEDVYEIIYELAKKDEGYFLKLYDMGNESVYADKPKLPTKFSEFIKDNPPSPTRIAELKAKYPRPEEYLITPDERKYIADDLSARQQAERDADEASFMTARTEALSKRAERLKSKASQVSGPPAEAVALSTSSATQSAGGEPPRAQPRSVVSSRGGRGGSVVSRPGREEFEAKREQARSEREAKELADPLLQAERAIAIYERRKEDKEAQSKPLMSYAEYLKTDLGKAMLMKRGEEEASRAYDSYARRLEQFKEGVIVVPPRPDEAYKLVATTKAEKQRKQEKEVIDEKAREIAGGDKVYADMLAFHEARGDAKSIALAKKMIAEREATKVVGKFTYRDPTPNELLMAVAGASGGDFFEKKDLARRKHQGDVLAVMKAQAGEKK